MKKLTTLLALGSLLSGQTQTTDEAAVPTDEAAATTGEAAVTTVETIKSNHWQNWVFAATAVVTATAAIFFISINNGHEIEAD